MAWHKFGDIGKIRRGEKVVIRDRDIIDSASILIRGGAGQTERFFEMVRESVNEGGEVDGIQIRKLKASPATGSRVNYFNEFDVLMITDNYLKDYRVYFSASDYRNSLTCKWYLVCDTKPSKKIIASLISSGADKRGHDLSFDTLGQSGKEDLTAFATITKTALSEAVDNLIAELNEGSSAGKKSKGFKDIA